MRTFRTRSRPHGPAALTGGLLTLLLATAACAAPGPPQLSAVDRSVRPGDDFYAFANNPWLAAAPPPGAAAYGTSTGLVATTRARVLALVQDAAAQPGAPGVRRQVGATYAALMDEAGIEAKGLAPLRDDLAAIAAIHDRAGLSAHLGRILRADIDGTTTRTEGLFGLWVWQGFNDAERYYPHLLQGGLGLADRDDYLNPAPAAAALRRRYQAHIAAVMTLAGVADAPAQAARIMALETRIAMAHASAADTADVLKTKNPWTRADFAAKAPGMDWQAWFQAAGLERQGVFIVWQPGAVSGISALIASQPLAVWKDYLRFRLLEHAIDVLPKAYVAEHAAFTANGAPQDRAQRALDATSAALGEAVGRLYVERYFPPPAKAAAVAMVENLRAAYRARIANLAWMSPATRDKALTKLAALQVGLGYPDHWIDYAPLVVSRDDAYGNARRIERFTYQLSLARLGRPVDPAEWSIAPHLVGAVILFSPNAMDFGAGLLQPPWFDPAGDAAANYGSAGAGIAHEISHSFDELGNQYDDQGRLVRWQTPEDLARYKAASAKLAAQFNAYCPHPDLCVNGAQTLGENVADLTGLMVAHDAYVASLNGAPDVVKDGMTGEQRFFLAFAQRWRRVQSEAGLRRQIATDIHAPGPYRSDTVRNLDAWYQAWGVAPGDRLYLSPEARARVW
jgi:predicted metalloendopeptidase